MRLPPPLGAWLVCLALALFPMAGWGFYTELVAKIMIMAIFASSLGLLVGFTGLASLGHAAFFGVAAYTVALLAPKDTAASLWIVFPAALAAAALTALVIGIFVLRTRGVYFIMVTLAFAQMVYFLVHDTALGGGSDGIYVNFKPTASIGGFVPFDLARDIDFYYVVLVLLVLVHVLLARVVASPFGRVLAAIHSNEQRTRSLGFPAQRYKLAAFVLAGTLAGIAGFLAACQFGVVNPAFLSWHQSANVLLMVILGGTGTLWGPVVGAFAFVLLQEVFSAWTRHWQLLLGGVILLAVLFLPGGLAGVPAQLRAWRRARRTHG